MQKMMSDQMGPSAQEHQVRAWLSKHKIDYPAAKELFEILYGKPKLNKENQDGQ